MILELIRSSTFLQIFKRNNSNEAEQPSLVSQYLLNHLLTFFHLHHVRFKSPSPRQFPLHHSTTHRHLSKAILLLLLLLLRSIILRTTFLTGNLSIYRLLTWIPLRRTFNDKSNKRCFRNYFSSILRGALNSSVRCIFSVGHVVGTSSLSQWRQIPRTWLVVYAQPSTITGHRLRPLSLENVYESRYNVYVSDFCAWTKLTHVASICGWLEGRARGDLLEMMRRFVG